MNGKALKVDIILADAASEAALRLLGEHAAIITEHELALRMDEVDLRLRRSYLSQHITAISGNVAEDIARMVIAPAPDDDKDWKEDVAPYDLTVSKLVVSEWNFIHSSGLHRLVDTIRTRQSSFGWRELELWVLRPNGSLELC